MDTMKGNHALHLAKEISKLPNGCFSISFYHYSKAKGTASEKLVTRTGCKARIQLPADRFSVDSENLFLFADKDGEPKACYKILIRYMAFPHDNFKMHKIDWL